MAMAKRSDEQIASAPGEAAAPMAGVHRPLLAVRCRLTRPVTVAFQDRETIVAVLTRRLEGDFRHLAVSKRDPRVCLACRTQSDGELLPGPLNVYFGDRFLGAGTCWNRCVPAVFLIYRRIHGSTSS